MTGGGRHPPGFRGYSSPNDSETPVRLRHVRCRHGIPRRTMSKRRPLLRPGLLAGGVFALVVTSGCSVDIQKQKIDHDEVEQKASENIGKEVGSRPDSVTCPDDLPFEKDATVRCTLRTDGVSYGLTAKVTDTDGNDARLSFQVDDQPMSSKTS